MNVSVYSEMRLRQIQFEFCLSAREERSICRQEKDNRERVGGGGGVLHYLNMLLFFFYLLSCLRINPMYNGCLDQPNLLLT